MTILTAGKQKKAFPLILWPSGNRSRNRSQAEHNISVTVAAMAPHHQHPPSLYHSLSPQQSEQQLFTLHGSPGLCLGLLLGKEVAMTHHATSCIHSFCWSGCLCNTVVSFF